MTTKLLAYHGRKETKQLYVDRVKLHQAADEIEQGYYWENGKGCAVGCTLHGSRHKDYETELGVPECLARLEDRLFEGMDKKTAKGWPLRFLKAIPVGADLSLVVWQFLRWVLADSQHGTMQHCTSKGKAATAAVVALIDRKLAGDEPSRKEWRKAADAAYAADADAAYAAADAAYAAYAAADAAYAAYAAAAAADAAYAAYAAYAAAAAARRNHFALMASKLEELLKQS